MIELIGKELFQWNKGRQLKINNSSVNEAVFSNDNITGLKAEIIDGIVDIPNVILTKGVRLFVYISITDDEKRETLYRKEFPIIPAAKPSDYIDENINIDGSTLEKLENLLDLMYNGSVDEILVFTNKGPQWVNKNKVFEAGVMKETDPTVSSWAKSPEKPKYTASEVGAYTKQETNDAIEAAKEIYVGSGEAPKNAVFQVDLEGEPFILDPIQATENMKTPVGIDAEGKLWVDIDSVITEKLEAIENGSY